MLLPLFLFQFWSLWVSKTVAADGLIYVREEFPVGPMVNVELTQIGQAGSHPGMQPLLIHPDTRDLEGSRFVHHARTPGLRLRSIPRTQIHSRSTCSKTSSALAVHSPWLRPSHPKAKLNPPSGKISEGSRICRFDKRYFLLIPAV